MKTVFTVIRPPQGRFDAAYADTFTEHARETNDQVEDETLEAGEHRGIFGAFDLELMFDAGWNGALEGVREIHKPFKIYDDCGHDHGDDPETPNSDVVDVDGIGLTCYSVYSICANCCAFGGDSQSEECASAHDHGPDKPICATAALWS